LKRSDFTGNILGVGIAHSPQNSLAWTENVKFNEIGKLLEKQKRKYCILMDHKTLNNPPNTTIIEFLFF